LFDLSLPTAKKAWWPTVRFGTLASKVSTYVVSLLFVAVNIGPVRLDPTTSSVCNGDVVPMPTLPFGRATKVELEVILVPL
jgi:hypothetical protein